jgi:hypothetical protein
MTLSHQGHKADSSHIKRDQPWLGQECLMVTSVGDTSTLTENPEEAPANDAVYVVASATLIRPAILGIAIEAKPHLGRPRPCSQEEGAAMMSNRAVATKRLANTRRNGWLPPPPDLRWSPLATIFSGKTEHRHHRDALRQTPQGRNPKRMKDPPRNLRPPQLHHATTDREFCATTLGAEG